MVEKTLDKERYHDRRQGTVWYGVEAALNTTEGFDAILAGIVQKKYRPRYLIGIGFGRMLNEIALHSESLQKVVCVDVSPQVVATGKLVRDLLIGNVNPVDFLRMTQDKDALRAKAGELEPQDGVEFAVSTIYKYFAEFQVKRALPLLKGEIKYRTGKVNVDMVDSYAITATLLQNYDLFRRLSLEEKLLIVEADITNPDFLQNVREELPSYDSSNVVVYVSHALQGLAPKLFVYEKLNSGGGTLLLKDATSYNIVVKHGDEPVDYRISHQNGRWKRSALIKHGDISMLVSALGTAAPTVQINYRNYSQWNEFSNNPQFFEQARESALILFHKLELHAGFSHI